MSRHGVKEARDRNAGGEDRRHACGLDPGSALAAALDQRYRQFRLDHPAFIIDLASRTAE